MAGGSKICPECGALNSSDATNCVRCNKRFPGPLVDTLVVAWESVLGTETPITRLFVGFCIVAYGLAMTTGSTFMQGPSGSQALRWGALVAPLAVHEPWRLVSASFLHFGIIHLGMNMMMLVYLGKTMEPVIRPSRFAVLLVLSAVGGYVASCVYDFFVGRFALTGGLSGGLYGLLGATVLYRFLNKDPTWKRLTIVVALYTLLFGLAFNVNHAAHGGGLLVGLVLGYVFWKDNRPWRRARLYQGLAALLVFVSIGSVLMANASDTWRVERAREIRRQGYQPVSD